MRNLKGGITLKGKYRIIQTDSITGKLIKKSKWINNLIMFGTNTGMSIILNRLGNVTTYDCIITSGEIGTGTNPPTGSDTALQTPVVTGITTAGSTINSTNVLISFFIPSASLANGTYTEFLLRAGTQAFARSIITPSYVKGANVDTTIEYIITGSN